MSEFTGRSGRVYTSLPIDDRAGFPQSFPVAFNGNLYHLRLYVNADPVVLGEGEGVLAIPASNAFLVVQVELENAEGSRAVIFLRKVTPELEYEAGEIALAFPVQRVAAKSINGQGDTATNVVGGIAARWASSSST